MQPGHTCMSQKICKISGGKKCLFFGKLCLPTKWMTSDAAAYFKLAAERSRQVATCLHHIRFRSPV